MQRLLNLATGAFPFWIAACGAAALFAPELFTWFSGPWIVWGMASLMFGLGLTLTFEDFAAVGRMPRAVLLGFLGQYALMPFLGWVCARIFDLDASYSVGLILLACCPGGATANVVAYLARANVCLAVVMNLCTTLAAVCVTPILAAFLSCRLVQMDGRGIFLGMLQVVVIPLVMGVLLNHWMPRTAGRARTALPLVSVVVIALVSSSLIGGNAAEVREAGPRLLGAVFTLHASGFALGYALARLMDWDAIVARTVSINVGMQNSTLGLMLARRSFADPLMAVPCAVSSVFHSVIGCAVAGWWRWRTPAASSDSAIAPECAHAAGSAAGAHPGGRTAT